MKKRILSLLLTLVMVLSLIPTTVWADGETVHVIVENTTFTTAIDGKSPAWTGTLVDKWVEINQESTGMSCIVDALGSYSQTGAETGYISQINGLAELDGGSDSGWIGTLNDWFTNEGLNSYTVANGDEIRMMYTCNLGADIGGDWMTMHNTKLVSLGFSGGELSPAFSADTTNYTLTLPEGQSSAELKIAAQAANKNNQVYITAGGTSYRRSASVPVQDDTVLMLRVGDAKEATTGEYATPAVVPTTYTITVQAAHSEPAVETADVTIRAQMAGGYLHGITTMEVDSDVAENYGYTDSVDGVSALDALVEAHKLIFGDGFTKETAADMLKVGSNGWISTIFGVSTYASGFYLNQGYPNDGTPASSGSGYNGTFTTNTKIVDGDVLDFYVMEDDVAYSDYYTWVEAPAFVADGQPVTVTVKGFYVMEGYRYKTPADLKAAASGVEGLQLAWVNLTTGATTAIAGAVTDENGQASFTADKASATGYLVAMSNADEEIYALMNPSEKVEIAEASSVTFKGLHNAQLNYLKVYTYTDGVKGSTDLLASQSTVADGYNLKYETELPAGDYWVEGYDGNNDCNGSLVLTVKEGENTFTLQRAYEIYATNAGWVEGVDYEIQVKVTDAGGTDLKAVTGKATAYGNTRTSCLFQEGGTIDVTLTPIGDKADSYLPVVIRKGGSDTTGKGALSLKGEIPQALGVTVIAPAGSTVSLGTQNNYYSYVFIEPDAIAKNEEDATTQVSFCLPSGGKTNFVRVQHPDGVTYWTFGKWTDGQKITVTEEDLHIGDDSFNKNTVYRFDKNVYDLGNVYLNINRQGYLNMDVGESFELDVFRNWQAIENFMNSQIALPDVNYRVISVNGGTSDVLTITPDKNNSSLATMTANKAGTAIVLVTYDAMTHMQGQSSTASKEFSAIWPECTGVFIVTVGADGSSIQTNTLMERPGITVTKDEQKYLDAEHDILFYLGSEGASYSFTPEAGCTVTVARSTVSSAMTFNGFTSNGVSVAADGKVTVTGLTTGRHIIKVEKGGLANYQVVTARGVSYDMYDAEGNRLASDTELNPGDTVSLQFHDLISPKEKLSGAYNPRFSLYYQDENGKSFSGAAGMYKFSGDSNYQKVEITIPESTEGFVYTLNGAIKVIGFDGVPTHRGISYTKGLDRQYGTGAAGVLAQLPTLTLKLTGYAENLILEVETKIDAIGEVTLDSEAAIAEARAAYDALTPEQQEKISNYEKLTAAEARLAELKGSGKEPEDLADIYKATGDYLVQQGTPAAGSSIGGEWTVIGLARSGRSIPGVSSYYNALVTYVKNYINPTTMRLSGSKSTENSRIILALTALGKDVTNVGGYNLLAGLNEMSYIRKQGTNGPVWALIALDSHDYAPQGDVTREKLIDTIIGLQMENGAWYISDSNKSADTDMTAMAIQALAPYYKTNAKVKDAVDDALAYLSSIQKADGSFSAANGGSASGESTAQVLAALCALGIDPVADSRFIKNGNTVLDGLCKFYVDGGGFRHNLNGERNAMATEQCYYALAAYFRMKAGKTALYDMSDVTLATNTPTNPTKPVTPATPSSGSTASADTGDSSQMTLWLGGVLLSAAALTVLTRKRKRS